jgi:outer membrane receptor protein involved in Fe transport
MKKQNRRRMVALAALLSQGLLAQTNAQSAPPAAAAVESEDEILVLSPFEVKAESDQGYVATQTLAGSRINTKLEDVGSAISVVTAEFLRDTGATDNQSLLTYTTNTEVAGPQGNFRSASGGQTEDESFRMTRPNSTTRVRGLTAADNTRNFFISDIPWDGYNVDRVDMQRGPNSILFGLGSPAGIINTTTKTAQHRDFRELEFRFGSYGSNRVALDLNQNILPQELSLRLNLVRADEKYKQDPAYSLQKRVFATLRYDPKFLNRGDHKTTLKVNFESGRVDSNNPRSITAIDQITPWWDKLNKTVYDPNLVHNSGWFYNPDQTTYYRNDAGAYNKSHASSPNGDGTANPTYQPWLGQPGMFGGLWLSYNPGQTAPYQSMMPEYRTLKGISSTGKIDGGIGGLPYSRRVSVASTAYYAERDSTAPYQSWGLWKATTLSDSSVFDFYNNLLDGDNKSEWQQFRNFNAALSQTFFNEKFGFEAAYDQQTYRSGQYAFAGNNLYIDINSHLTDGTPNPNVGRPYVETSYGFGNSASTTTREASRLSAYFDHNFNKRGDGRWYQKLLGRHTVSGLYSRDMYKSDSRSFRRYGTPDIFGDLVATGTAASQLDSNDRVVATTVYLGESLLNASTYKGANIPNPDARIEVPDVAQFRYYDSTWKATSVDPAAVWTNTYSGQTSTESENPANYVGWKTLPVNILSAEDGDQDALTTGATLGRRKVESKAATWQAYFWDGAVVGMYGIRNDKVKSWAFDATRVNNRADFAAVDKNGQLQYSTAGKPYALHEANSPSWSVVAKLNKIAGRWADWLPVNVNFYYNKSQNFQITGTRNDIYGQALAAPSGETLDRGIMVSTKDERFVLRVNKYETTVKNANNSTGIPTWYFPGGVIQRQEDRADAYEYHLAELGRPETADGTGSWTWRYAPRPGETQEQADALAAAAVAGWRAYTKEPIVQKIMKAWGFNDFNVTQLTTMSTPVANFVATEDQVSKGWEYEFTANPTKNWRITMNASDTQAMRVNIGGETLQEFVDLTNTYHQGPMGDLRQWGGGALTSTALLSWNSNFYSKYLLMKLQEGTFSSELRRWHYNLVSNYSFTEGKLKGFNVGAGYRWMDKVAIGYPVIKESASKITFDLDNPYYGPKQDAIDLWVGYERKLTSKIDWRIQLNIRNLGDGNKLIPLSTQYDGTVAAWGIAPSQSWTLTNTFRF